MDITKELIKLKWTYHQVFWDLLDKLIYKKSIETEKDILKALWYKDIDFIFKSEVDENIFNKLSKIIFRFYESNEKWN